MIQVSEIEEWLNRIYIAADGAGLRLEDRRKAVEVAAMLEEIERAVDSFSRRSPLLLVDAAAGKSYVGLLAAKLFLDRDSRHSHVITLERDAKRVEVSLLALQRLDVRTPVECRVADVSEEAGWPQEISIVAALHACGPAADAIIERTIKSRARRLLLVPCCTSNSVASALQARAKADAFGIPRHAPVRRRFIQAIVDTHRTWRLEASGYQTEVVEFVPPTVTPHNLLWRARYVGEPKRMKVAQEVLEKFSTPTV
jgi:hypothetical protein